MFFRFVLPLFFQQTADGLTVLSEFICKHFTGKLQADTECESNSFTCQRIGYNSKKSGGTQLVINTKLLLGSFLS